MRHQGSLLLVTRASPVARVKAVVMVMMVVMVVIPAIPRRDDHPAISIAIRLVAVIAWIVVMMMVVMMVMVIIVLSRLDVGFC